MQCQLAGYRFGGGLHRAQGMGVEPARLGRQGQDTQGFALGIADRCRRAVHAALAQTCSKIFFGQDIHQTVFGNCQASAVGALHRLQQTTADRRQVQAAKVQGHPFGIGEIDMPTGVVGQQPGHDLRCAGNQHPVKGQPDGQHFGADKTVGVIQGIYPGNHAAPPGVPDYLPDPCGLRCTAAQARLPGLLHVSDGTFAQRGRSQGGEVIEVFATERHGQGFLCLCFRHVSVDMSSK